MSCEEIRKDLEAYARGEIEGDREREIARHLDECEECRAESESVKQVLDSVAGAHEETVIQEAKRIIQAAIVARASDVHLLPQKDGYAVRFRIDGVLREQERLGRAAGTATVTRLKVMGQMDATHRASPQDGRIHIRHGQEDIDLRVNVIPTVFGEKVTMRLLCRRDAMLGLEKLGLSAEHLALVQEFLTLAAGLFVATGPTGSGRTTLLYSMLGALNAEELNIATIEDPVEFTLPGMAQTHVNRKAGMTFAVAMRSLFRADPDVIMCGEIRDLDTAEVVLQAAITGHLVLTTLHAVTAPEVFRRLLNMGVEPFLTADAVKLVCGQRLARMVCGSCREEYYLEGVEREWLLAQSDIDPTKVAFYRGKGCDECSDTGYRGRMGLFELLRMTDTVRDLIATRASRAEADRALADAGHETLADDGIEKARLGLTTIAEVMAVTRGL